MTPELAGVQAGILRPLDDVVAERRIKPRDCRRCAHFQPAADGLAYGWCHAHEQFVKLYHPDDDWYSQCLFKSLRRERELTSNVPVSDGRLAIRESASAPPEIDDR